MAEIAIVDYGLANIRSVCNALSCFDVGIRVCASGDDLEGADGIVLPGVGSFDAGMEGLRARGHVEALERLALRQGVPLLGICLGLQFLFESSEEGQGAGLGWLPGRIRRFAASGLKVPHMGWSQVDPQGAPNLFRDLVQPLDFYFVHSFYVAKTEDQNWVAGTCDYGRPFVAAVEHNNIQAVQFHPEKSQLAGMKLLETFVGSCR